MRSGPPVAITTAIMGHVVNIGPWHASADLLTRAGSCPPKSPRSGLLWGNMRFKRSPDTGFGSSWSLSVGWLQIDWSRFEDHWHLQIMWASPNA